jgi:hypothetical protein
VRATTNPTGSGGDREAGNCLHAGSRAGATTAIVLIACGAGTETCIGPSGAVTAPASSGARGCLQGISCGAGSGLGGVSGSRSSEVQCDVADSVQQWRGVSGSALAALSAAQAQNKVMSPHAQGRM